MPLETQPQITKETQMEYEFLVNYWGQEATKTINTQIYYSFSDPKYRCARSNMIMNSVIESSDRWFLCPLKLMLAVGQTIDWTWIFNFMSIYVHNVTPFSLSLSRYFILSSSQIPYRKEKIKRERKGANAFKGIKIESANIVTPFWLFAFNI